MTLNASQLEHALRKTGERLIAIGAAETVRLYLVGGSAGMLAGLLRQSRSTADVDVTTVEPEKSWGTVLRAAKDVAKELDLPQTWLNNKCQVYAWCLPLGWQGRCELSQTFGPLEIWLLSREDFVAAKVVSAPGRPQDFEDLLAVAPTAAELSFTEEHIDRLECEHLDPDHSFDDARTIVQSLRGDA